MAISDELTLLATTKANIKNSINAKGGSITNETPFSDYATAIDNLPSGGSGNPLLTSIDVSDFTGTTFNRATSYITDVTIPSGVTSIENNAFQYCSALTSVNIPNSVTSIGNNAFNSCTSLTSVNIPSGVTSIGYSAFGACSSLSGHITVPPITIGYDATSSSANMFESCSNITTVTLSDGITVLPNKMFLSCTRLTSVNIPSTVTKLGNNVFNGTAITGVVTIPSGVTEIDTQCFDECPNITALVLLPTTPPYKKYASSILGGSSYPIYVPAASVDAYKAATNWSTYASRIYPIQQVATVDGSPVYNYEIGNTDSATISDDQRSKIPTGDSIEFAEGVAYIQGQLGAYEEVILPSTFTGFGDTQSINAATTTLTSKATTPPSVDRNNLGGSGLTAIYVPNVSVDTYKDDVVWGTFSSIIQPIPVTVATLTLNDTSTVDIIDTTGLGTIQQSMTRQYASTTVGVLIKADTLGIDSRAFRNFANLASVTFESGSQCTTIGQNAFLNCTSLTSITLPDLVSVIDTSAFSGCTSLETVTIGDGIMEMRVSVFSGCESLTDITILADAAPDASGEDPFEGCDATITLHVPAASVEAYQAWLNDDIGTAGDVTVVAISE